MTETNAYALTAVFHFLADRHTNEDHKSNESLQDSSWVQGGTPAGIGRSVD